MKRVGRSRSDRGLVCRDRGIVVILLVVSGVLAVAPPLAGGAVQTERYEAAAHLLVQGAFHHDAFRKIDAVQERNEFRFDLEYQLLPQKKDFLFVDTASINVLYRARYDAIYDIRHSYGQRGYRRDDFRFPEGKYPREFFFDLKFHAPVSARIGRQQVVWGEADLFRSLDVVNPLRIDQNGLVGEDFDSYREPLWIAKFLFDLGQVGPVSESNLEILYSPNGRPLTDRAIAGEVFRIGVDTNNTLDGLRRPNGSPFSRVRHPWELTRVGTDYTDGPDQADFGADRTTCADGLGCGDFVYLIQNGIPTSVVDFHASMVGVRFLGKTFAGIDFSLNYLFKRTDIPGIAGRVDDLFDPNLATDGSVNVRPELLVQAATAEAPIDTNGNGVPDGREDLYRRCIHKQEPLLILTSVHGPRPDGSVNPFSGCELVGLWYPWTHIVGATLTYNDFDFTGFVFRVEQSFSTKEPRTNNPMLIGPRAGEFPTRNDFETHLKKHTQVWRSMIGFDYLRSIMNPPPKSVRRYWWATLLKDQWFLSFQFFNEYWANTRGNFGMLASPTDRQNHWNPVFTFLMTGFFHHNLLRPFLAFAYDVNTQFPVAWIQAEYFLGRRWSIRLADVIYAGSRNAESFLFLNKYADRDTLLLTVSYYLI